MDDAEELTTEVLGQKKKYGVSRKKSVAAIRNIQEIRRKISVGARSRTHTDESSGWGSIRSRAR